IMIGMGMSLTVNDFKRILKEPRAVFIGFLNQIILLPLVAYILIKVLNVDAVIAVGIMILSACPGGPTSNLLTLIAKGDTALSVSLTAVNSLVTIITIPFIVNFAVFEFMTEASRIDAPIGKIAGSLIVVVALPLMIGMMLKKFKGTFANKMEKPVRIASSIVLLVVIAGLVVKEKDNIGEYFKNAWLIALALNVATMVVGFITAKLTRLSFKQALCICIESGNQNGTLAIHIAVVSLGRPDFAIAAVVYSLVMFITPLLPIYIGNKKKEEPTVDDINAEEDLSLSTE
ncbi:MAG: bile acid:sodium symporter family protein, partial [Lentisphaeraceae bacterium]|nr:bile acid:sodium symporter family protein [Lentisphaeraceae bacterium]